MKKAETTGKPAPPEKAIHVKIGGTDYDITEVRRRELTFGSYALSRDEIATKSTPEPFGP
jgi:hypothetical protein